MRVSIASLLAFILTGLIAPAWAVTQKPPAQSQRILNAKTVYLNNQTGSDAVGKTALVRLKKWGKFQVVQDPKKADLIFLLSSDPYHDGNLIMSGGQTGSIDSTGNITEDSAPNYNKLSSTRYAYLTVIDVNTGDTLWKAQHPWGGLLTGFNSVGERLIKQLQKQIKK